MTINDMKETSVFILVICVVFAVLFSIAYGLVKLDCYSKTQGIGVAADFSFFGGCRIEIEPGKWIPIENYRYFEGDK